jgi:hypothetical protein
MTCETVSALQWVAGGFALVSAALWTAASLFKTPPPPVTYESIDAIAAALKNQGRYNAWAAIAAAVAVGIQAILLLAPTCIHLS